MIFTQADFGLFIGRFHPLVVHLPIGFLLLGSIFYFLSKRTQWGFLQKALPLTFLLATIGSFTAVGLGWFLAKEGGYNEPTLSWHRYLGIATTLLSGVMYLHFSGRFGHKPLIANWGLAIGVLLLSITGHLGGQLTHGNGYLLEYAPTMVKKVLETKTAKDEQLAFPINPDSIFLYRHFIQPIFNKKCIGCHNTKQARGGLNLADRRGLLAGGDHGDVLEAKPQQGSLLLHRITLESNNPKYMPPKGIPLNYTEIRLLDYWIKTGHSFEQTITDKTIPTEIQQLFQDKYGLSKTRKSYVEIKQVPAADPRHIQKLVEAGFTLKKLAQSSNFWEVTYRDTLDCTKLQALQTIKVQLAWLNLSKTGLTNDCLEYLQGFPNLTRLRLSQNPIDNQGLSFLKDLSHLESLNLYQTSVDEQGLSYLKPLEQLQKLYLGQTQVDSSARAQVKTQFPLVEVLFD